jgi:hypothetical protein
MKYDINAAGLREGFVKHLYETPVTTNKFGMRRVNSLQLKRKEENL